MILSWRRNSSNQTSIFDGEDCLGQYFTGQLGEVPPDSWSSVEDHSRRDDAVENVNDRVPYEGSGAAVVLRNLGMETITSSVRALLRI